MAAPRNPSLKLSKLKYSEIPVSYKKRSVKEGKKIRRLTPKEVSRLQGFPDDWNEYGEFDGEVIPMSDTQRYKQCGNAVTVNVVQAVAERIKN